MSADDHRGKFDLPTDYKGGWETDRDKALWGLSLTVEQRLELLEEMQRFAQACQEANAIR